MMLCLTINIGYPLRHDRIHEIVIGLNTDFGEDFYTSFRQTLSMERHGNAIDGPHLANDNTKR